MRKSDTVSDVFINRAPSRLYNEARPKEADTWAYFRADLDTGRYVQSAPQEPLANSSLSVDINFSEVRRIDSWRVESRRRSASRVPARLTGLRADLSSDDGQLHRRW